MTIAKQTAQLTMRRALIEIANLVRVTLDSSNGLILSESTVDYLVKSALDTNIGSNGERDALIKIQELVRPAVEGEGELPESDVLNAAEEGIAAAGVLVASPTDELKALAAAVASAAERRGIIAPGTHLTGPQLIMLCSDLAAEYVAHVSKPALPAFNRRRCAADLEIQTWWPYARPAARSDKSGDSAACAICDDEGMIWVDGCTEACAACQNITDDSATDPINPNHDLPMNKLLSSADINRLIAKEFGDDVVGASKAQNVIFAINKLCTPSAAGTTPVTRAIDGEALASVPDAVAMECLREVAKGLDSVHHQTQEAHCIFCNANMDDHEAHGDECLTLRARAAIAYLD